VGVVVGMVGTLAVGMVAGIDVAMGIAVVGIGVAGIVVVDNVVGIVVGTAGRVAVGDMGLVGVALVDGMVGDIVDGIVVGMVVAGKVVVGTAGVVDMVVAVCALVHIVAVLLSLCPLFLAGIFQCSYLTHLVLPLPSLPALHFQACASPAVLLFGHVDWYCFDLLVDFLAHFAVLVDIVG